MNSSIDGATILLYHGITTGQDVSSSRRERKYWVSLASFRQQVEMLDRNRHRMSGLAEFWNGGAHCSNAIVVTFDDGLVSDYDIVFPMLAEAGLSGTFFLNTGTVGTAGHVTWGHVKEMYRFGMAFGSHAHDHVYLSRLPYSDIEKQIVHSKLLIEDCVGAPVTFLSAPYGDINESVLYTALGAGYTAVCRSRSWPAQPGVATLPRTVVYGTTMGTHFARLISGSPVFYVGRASREAFMDVAKQIVTAMYGNPLRVPQRLTI